MSKQKLTLSQEATVLFWIENYRGKQMKGESRVTLYEIYRYFKQDRDKDVCTCLDRDTHKKVEGFINNIDWSEETRTSEKMKQVLPDSYIEPLELEEVSTQPIDMSEVLESMKIRTTIPQEDAPKLKKPTAKRGRPRKTKK